ncbi:MAG: cation transporter [Coriobacteriaceae bacterium]|nr:cation transporter [Coriobacteriaceae bacterium]
MGYTKHRSDDGGRIRAIRRTLWAILFLNIAVAVAKLGYGTITGSVAMQADGFHSMFDGTSNAVGLVGMWLASRPADRDHPYGHGKYETYASAAIGGMLVFAAWRVGSSAWEHLVGTAEPVRVDAVSFGVMAVTLAVNLGITVYERRAGRKLGSAILIADASHTASDMLVSLGVIAGLAAVKFGYPKADPLIALLVALAIIYTAWEILKHASVTLSDASRIAPQEIRDVVMGVPGVMGCHSIRTRGSEYEVYVDLHVQVDRAMSVEGGHAVAESAEREVCEAFDRVADVIAHLEPMDDYQRWKTAEESHAGE